MSAALGLLRVQQVDTRLDQVEAQLERVGAALSNDRDLRAAEDAVKLSEGVLAETERNRGETEHLATSVRAKMRQAEASLYGGAIRNPKELQELQADVASLKKHLVSLDETELQWMQRLEEAEGELLQARARLSDASNNRQASIDLLLEQQAQLNRKRESLQSEREAAAAPLAAEHLATYARLRHAKRGLAVSPVNDGACGACGTMLTAALQQAARHAPDLVNCPSCGRILYGD
jgi:predicted  nucleic acid-binding Zn-ribbon protein